MRNLSIRGRRKGKEGLSASPSGSFPVAVCIRPASEIPVRIESAESPVEANCQLLRRSQPEAYCATELEIPWRGSLESSATRQDYRIHSSVYIHTYICYLQKRRICFGPIGRGGRYALTCQKFNPSAEIHGSLEYDSEISRIACTEISIILVKRL